jgi:hypothetical protein
LASGIIGVYALCFFISTLINVVVVVVVVVVSGWLRWWDM